MMTIEIRVNGQLIEAVNVVNTGTTKNFKAGQGYECMYDVWGVGAEGKKYEVIHNRNDGAVALACVALSEFER